MTLNYMNIFITSENCQTGSQIPAKLIIMSKYVHTVYILYAFVYRDKTYLQQCYSISNPLRKIVTMLLSKNQCNYMIRENTDILQKQMYISV